MNKRKIFYWIAGIILVGTFYYWVFTRPFSQYTNLEKGGPIGDAINGLTTPLIGLLGAVLIYISFLEQVKANKIQSQALNEQRELDLFYKFYEELKIDLQRIQSEYGTKYEQPSVLDSMMNYYLIDRQPPYEELNIYIEYIFNQFIFLGKRISRTKSLSDSEVVYLIEKIRHLYQLYFDKYYNQLSGNFFESGHTQKFKKSFQEVATVINDLNKIHDAKKDLLSKVK